MSPLLASDDLIQKLPKITIFCGKKDPIRDDSIRLLHKLTKNHKLCKLFLYEHFSHGFYSFALKINIGGFVFGVKESFQALEHLSE